MVAIASILRRLAGMLIMLYTLGAAGQATPNGTEPKPWSTLQLGAASPDAKWVSYTNDYTNAPDTLFLKNVKSGKTINFPKGYNGQFAGNKAFVCRMGEVVAIIPLDSGRQVTVAGAVDYKLLPNGTIAVAGKTGDSGQLQLFAADGMLRATFSNVTGYVASPSGKQLLYSYRDSDQNKLLLYDLASSNKTILSQSSHRITNLAWSKNENAVAFLEKAVGDSVTGAVIFDLKLGKVHRLDPATCKGFPKGMHIAGGYNPLSLSNDGQRLLFGIANDTIAAPNPNAVQLWNGNDNWLYPQRSELGNWEAQDKTAMWWPENAIFRQLTTDALPMLLMDGQRSFAITFNPEKVSNLKYRFYEDTDFYITDLESGRTDLWLKDHPTDPAYTLASPAGMYMAYAKGKDWWAYDFAQKKHFCFTAGLSGNYPEPEYGHFSGYTIAGWSPGDRSVFLADRSDIWEVVIATGKVTRLTNGSERQVVFTPFYNDNDAANHPDFSGFASNLIDPDTGFLLSARDTDYRRSGYYKYSRKGGLRELVYDGNYNDQPRIAGGSLFYRSQRYDAAPALMRRIGINASTSVFRSNPQHDPSKWGSEELITYANNKGESLNGILYYPAGYERGRQYPMVVSIYQKQSDGYHRFLNPGEHNGGGINVSDFNNKGYLVLLPDIAYRMGDPDVSATEWVTAAVAAVVAKGCADPARIGLVGHSFGGYEANFIATQTGIFATVISGAGISDIRAFYLSVGKNLRRPDLFRFEHNQFRMGKSLFEDPERYRRNNPIEFVQNIRVPMLIWTGDSDKEVPNTQSIGMYIALKRLGKKTILLQYPKESHALTEPAAMQDLSIRIFDWFDYYLKGEPPAKWIVDGTSERI